MESRERWLEEGLTVLDEVGVRGLRIEHLAHRLGLTKGSFYHHFAGMSGYRLDLLDHYRRQYTTRYIDVVEADASLGPAAKLHKLAAVVTEGGSRPRLESAIRSWAGEDDDAHATMREVDSGRTAYLAKLLRDLVPPGEVKRLSRMLYLVVVGADQVVPRLTPRQRKDAFDVVLGLLVPLPRS